MIQAEKLFNSETDDGDFKVGLDWLSKRISLLFHVFRQAAAGSKSSSSVITSDSVFQRQYARSLRATTSKSW